MIERSQELCLALEPREALGIERKAFRQDLDRDVAIQFRVTGAIDLAHSTRAERRDDLVRTDTGAAVQPQTSLAISTTSDSFRFSSSTVTGFPMKLLAKPHCGLKHS